MTKQNEQILKELELIKSRTEAECKHNLNKIENELENINGSGQQKKEKMKPPLKSRTVNNFTEKHKKESESLSPLINK